jgi:mono/diheme cytochrome c family protein
MGLSVVALTSIAASVIAAGQAPAQVDAVRGKQRYEQQTCYYCHGTAGQGGRDGARIAATGMTLQAFVRYVRRPAGAMPAFTEKILSEQDLADIHAYLKSLPSARAPRDIALLDQLRDNPSVTLQR